jgi:uncharacterized damage-inducible protein DinB
MNTDYIRTIFNYNVWAHNLVWDCIAQLSDEQFVQDLDYSIGSIRNQVVHVMSVDRRWFARVAGVELPARLAPEDFLTRPSVRAQWDEIEQQNRAIVLSLDDMALDRVITYELGNRGGLKSDAVWQIIAHVVNHGTDHRGQILAMLHRMGAPTTEQDMIIYLWENA